MAKTDVPADPLGGVLPVTAGGTAISLPSPPAERPVPARPVIAPAEHCVLHGPSSHEEETLVELESIGRGNLGFPVHAV